MPAIKRIYDFRRGLLDMSLVIKAACRPAKKKERPRNL
jgi:hypothetical protein